MNFDLDEGTFNYWCHKMLKKDDTPLNRKFLLEGYEILTVKERDCFRLNRMEGLNAKEISKELNIGLGTVYQRLRNCDEKLRRYFGRKNPYLVKFFE